MKVNSRLLLFTCLVTTTTTQTVSLTNITAGNSKAFAKLMTPDNGYKSLYNKQPVLQSAELVVTDLDIADIEIKIESLKSNISHVNQISVTPCHPLSSKNDNFQVKIHNSSLDRVREKYHVQQQDSTPAAERTSCYNITFTTSGKWLGYSTLRFVLATGFGDQNETVLGEALLTVLREDGLINKIFTVALQGMVALTLFGMGNDMNVAVIKEHMRRPKAPVAALISQCIFMPLLAFSLIHITGIHGGAAMGLFVLGTSPGGGTSNMFSKLLNGDMSVSITMTTLSTIASLAMIPLWLYTLGSVVPASNEVGRVEIPFLSILFNLLMIIVPLIIGYIVQRKLPRVSAVICKCLKVMFIIFILITFSVGIYTNLYFFHYVNTALLFAMAILPFGGYICGGLLAWIVRLDWKLIKTVSIETGMQNFTVPVLIIKSALGSPDAELALIPVFSAVLMTSFPLQLITVIYLIQRKCRSKRERKDISSESITEDSADEKLRVEAGLHSDAEADTVNVDEEDEETQLSSSKDNEANLV